MDRLVPGELDWNWYQMDNSNEEVYGKSVQPPNAHSINVIDEKKGKYTRNRLGTNRMQTL